MAGPGSIFQRLDLLPVSISIGPSALHPPKEVAPLRASHPTLIAASRIIGEHRDTMVARWVEWLGERLTGTATASRAVVEAEFRLILDVFAALVGPLRREVKPLWGKVAERYGRHAAARGLAAGEVVEEMQYLRELLIRYLAPAIAALRPRQGMALLLRLNRLVDKGVGMAVVGYTDAMVATILPKDGNVEAMPDADEISRSLKELQSDLDGILTVRARA